MGNLPNTVSADWPARVWSKVEPDNVTTAADRLAPARGEEPE